MVHSADKIHKEVATFQIKSHGNLEKELVILYVFILVWQFNYYYCW